MERKVSRWNPQQISSPLLVRLHGFRTFLPKEKEEEEDHSFCCRNSGHLPSKLSYGRDARSYIVFSPAALKFLQF